MIEIEKYAQAAASTARTPPNSPARQAAIEAENTARVAAEQFVKGLKADADRLDWMSRNEARIGWNCEGDMCRVWVQGEDGDFVPPCGWRVAFEDHRTAIDAAIKEQS